jgi:hypothetical protein
MLLLEFMLTQPASGGLNLQYVPTGPDEGLGLYSLVTPYDMGNSGFGDTGGFGAGLGAGMGMAIGIGEGPYTGIFESAVGSYGPVEFGTFWSPEGTEGWAGFTLGVCASAIPAKPGLVVVPTNYEKIDVYHPLDFFWRVLFGPLY